MASRAAVHSLVEEDLAAGQPLADLGFTSVYAAEDIDTPADRMFVVIRWNEKQATFGNRGPQRVTIWVHSRDKDYTPLDDALLRIAALMDGAVQRPGADGWTLTTSRFDGESPDLSDDGFGTITRNADFTVASRYTTT